MGSILKGIGIGTITAIAGTLIYLYMTDIEVQQKTNKAINEIKGLTDLLKNKTLQKNQSTLSYEDLTTQNQQWVYNQWESIGV